MCLLPRRYSPGNFWPVWAACLGQKFVRIIQLIGYGDRVMHIMRHVPINTMICEREESRRPKCAVYASFSTCLGPYAAGKESCSLLIGSFAEHFEDTIVFYAQYHKIDQQCTAEIVGILCEEC